MKHHLERSFFLLIFEGICKSESAPSNLSKNLMECLFFVLRKKRKKWKVSVQLFANSGVVLGQTYVMSYLCKEKRPFPVMWPMKKWEGKEKAGGCVSKFLSH